MTAILVINGPNLNALGRREQSYYGSKTLPEINAEISKKAAALGVSVVFYQSNVEGHLIDCIQGHWSKVDGIIINAGAFTHYAYALKDALLDARVPVVEVHLSNPYARDEWRRRSVIADIARGQVAGFGWRGYLAALELLAATLADAQQAAS